MKRTRRARLFHLDRFGAHLDRSVDEEVRFHLETRVEQLVRSGLSPEEARAEVMRRFGDPDRVVERCRRIDGRATRRMATAERASEALKDLKLAFRSLLRAPGYTVVSVASLAVGIGVNAALLTAVHAIWVAPVPGVTGPERIVDPVVVQGGGEEWAWAYPDFAAVLEAQTPFESLAAWAELHVTMVTDEGGQRLRAALTTSAYFQVLGAAPGRGRGFLPAEDEGPGQHPVVVISHDLWQERFGGRSDIVGQSVTLNRTPYTVVGVASEGFRGARVTLSRIDVWMPLMQHPRAGGAASSLLDRERLWVQVLGRLRPGATRPEAEAALQTVFGRLSADFPESNRDRMVRAASFGRFPAQNRVLDMLGVASVWGLVAVLLLIICANLAGMTLARSASREREISVRLALGSTRFRLVRHLMAEAVLLAMSGAVIGVGLAVVGMSRVSPVELGISAPDVTFEPRGWVVAISFAVSLATAVAFGLLPALRFSRSELVAGVKDDAGGGGRRVGRIQRVAASAQAGAALWLLVVGALFLRSLGRTDPASLGFDPGGMLVADFSVGGLSSPLLDMAAEGYPTLEQGGASLVDRLEEALASLPGVESVAVADGIPLDRVGQYARVARADQADEAGGQVVVEATTITEAYFATLGMSLLRGRGFQRTDDAASEPVAVITESLAERLWPGQDPLGRQLLWAAGTADAVRRTVVGVVGHVASSRASAELPHVFLPLRQGYVPSLLVMLRADGDASLLASGLREAFHAVDPGLPTPRLVPAASFVARATQEQRATGQIGAALGFVVLLLSAMGVYGVVALAATQRTREIGLRVALGATRGEVVRRVLADALRLAVPGMLAGALLAAGTAAALRSMLLGLSPLDPVSFLSVGALLLLVVVLAGLAPALRASGIQPVQALKAG